MRTDLFIHTEQGAGSAAVRGRARATRCACWEYPRINDYRSYGCMKLAPRRPARAVRRMRAAGSARRARPGHGAGALSRPRPRSCERSGLGRLLRAWSFHSLGRRAGTRRGDALGRPRQAARAWPAPMERRLPSPARPRAPPSASDPAGRRPDPGTRPGAAVAPTSQGLLRARLASTARCRAAGAEQSAGCRPDGAVTGSAALRMAGADLLRRARGRRAHRQPVPLAVGPAPRSAPTRRRRLARATRAPRRSSGATGSPCTRVVRALFDEMRRVRDWREAVVALDMAAAADLVSVRQLTAYVAGHARWRRTVQVRRALPHASELSRSPQRDPTAPGLGARRRAAASAGEPRGVHAAGTAARAWRTCSTRSPGSSASSTAPTTAAPDGTARTSPGRRASGARVWRS